MKTINPNVMKKETVKFILQTIVSIITAVLTALGASGCVRALQ